MSAQPIPRISAAAYLEFERASDSRNEFYDGQIYAMSGGSLTHATLIASLARLLGNELADKPCRVTASELLVRAFVGGPYMYPDLVVLCGEPQLADDKSDVLLNPTTIVEVLSKSTEAHDRGRKFASYRQIESLQEYILVAQSEARVETFLRQARGEWLLTEYAGLEASCICKSIGCTRSRWPKSTPKFL